MSDSPQPLEATSDRKERDKGESLVRERLEQRLGELRAEFESGEQTLAELEAQAGSTRQTKLRISGVPACRTIAGPLLG